MKFPKVLAVVSGLVIGLTATVGLHASAASVPDEQWNLPMNGPGQDGAELIGLKIAGSSTGLNYPSYIAGDSKGQSNRKDMLVCNSINDSICAPAARVNYEAFLPPCDAKVLINCVVGISAIKSDGSVVDGQYSQDFPVAGPNDYQGDPARNLPTGGRPSVWKIPGVTNGGGTDTYLLRFDVKGDAAANQKFRSNSIEVSLFPMTVQTGDYATGNMTDANHPSGGCLQDHFQCGDLGFEHGGNDVSLSAACVSFDKGSCALRQAFPEGYRFKINARLGDSPAGWFHGRLFSPVVTLNSTESVTNLSVEANPVKVPVIGGYIKQSEMTPEMKAYYTKNRATGSFGRLSANGISNLVDIVAPYQSNIFELFAMWSKVFSDKASATQSEWSFRTLELNGDNNSCFRDSSKLVGVVSTNAMMYSGGAPAFNKSEGTLDYKVGAPHLASNGDVFKGSYDLQLRSDIARCLYNFSNAPIKATVSIASDNGDSNVATTIVNEDKATGWLHMSASNFMFSNPTVKIKFTQEAPVRSTIVCVKGKVTKTVTGVKPVCPSGYKKK
jgi:hypothetical protein